MNSRRVFITGMGILSPLGSGVRETLESLKAGKRGIGPLSLFPVFQDRPLPAGQINSEVPGEDVPRSHRMALIAANEALADSKTPPDAIVIGSTTGGMLRTEELLKEKNTDPKKYAWHATGSIAEYLARKTGCTGPVLTVSTACSSGTAVLKIGLELIRTGRATTVLAGGVDSLCRLTYYGFNSLQLLDPEGARPFDRDRRGMSVAEGAGMLLLTGSETIPENAFAEVLGAGLSCDAHHLAAPHPEGEGALKAMSLALEDAGLGPQDVDYINLHGTGTKENDSSEAKAVAALFSGRVPYLSSIKGATGHSLAAAGAIEAVVSCLCIGHCIVPGNTGFSSADDSMPISPTMANHAAEVKTVLSNSFGFGGNNAAVVIARPSGIAKQYSRDHDPVFTVRGLSCITGAGDLDKSLAALDSGSALTGLLSLDEISAKLPQKSVRRLKRLPRLALTLATGAHEESARNTPPEGICFGTGWGAMSETYDFIMKLYETNEEFTSPTDFVGSVHNAPAGQAAIWLKSTGPNMTMTGGDYSFEQALFTAGLVCDKGGTVLVVGADEYHPEFSDLLDGSVKAVSQKSDGGGALVLERGGGDGVSVCVPFFGCAEPGCIETLIHAMGGADRINGSLAALFVGIPASMKKQGGAQLDEFIAKTGFAGPVIRYREFLGEYAAASAAATVLAASFVRTGAVPKLPGAGPFIIDDEGVAMISLGSHICCIELR